MEIEDIWKQFQQGRWLIYGDYEYVEFFFTEIFPKNINV